MAEPLPVNIEPARLDDAEAVWNIILDGWLTIYPGIVDGVTDESAVD